MIIQYVYPANGFKPQRVLGLGFILQTFNQLPSGGLVGLWSNVYVLQASGSYFQINAGGERINIQGTGESIDA